MAKRDADSSYTQVVSGFRTEASSAGVLPREESLLFVTKPHFSSPLITAPTRREVFLCISHCLLIRRSHWLHVEWYYTGYAWEALCPVQKQILQVQVFLVLFLSWVLLNSLWSKYNFQHNFYNCKIKCSNIGQLELLKRGPSQLLHRKVSFLAFENI